MRRRGKAKQKTNKVVIEDKAHQSKRNGDKCPCGGTLCQTSEVRIHRTVCRSKSICFTRQQQLEVLRCSGCSDRFVAAPHIGPGEENGYSAEVRADFAVQLSNGIPENRISNMYGDQGIKISRKDINQSNRSLGEDIEPLIKAMEQQIADSDVIQTDGSKFQINACKEIKENPDYKVGDRKNPEDRSHSEATVLLGCNNRQELTALIFYLDQVHPGEHFEDVLKLRTRKNAPILMGDMGSTIDTDTYKAAKKEKLPLPYNRAGCLDHTFVHFEKLHKKFPKAKLFLEALSEIYYIDKLLAQAELHDPLQRQLYHAEFSLPIMQKLLQLANDLLDGAGHQKVEPNSAFGIELRYFIKHFEVFTLFCKIPGCPLSNIKSETANKRIILIRKNSMYYQTLESARSHANILSLATTARLIGLNVHAYLLDLIKNLPQMKKDPKKWTPKAYLDLVIAQGADPSRLTELYRPPKAGCTKTA